MFSIWHITNCKNDFFTVPTVIAGNISIRASIGQLPLKSPPFSTNKEDRIRQWNSFAYQKNVDFNVKPTIVIEQTPQRIWNFQASRTIVKHDTKVSLKVIKMWRKIIASIIIVLNFCPHQTSSVKAIRPEFHQRYNQKLVGNFSNLFNTSVEDQSCPERCMCFEFVVRCLFLRIKRVPRAPRNTTDL